MATDISALRDLDGFIGACLVDSETGLVLSTESGNSAYDLEAAGAANTEVVRAKNRAMKSLGLSTGNVIEDILDTMTSQYNLLRPLTINPQIFVFVALDRKAANLGMARIKLRQTEESLTL